jgi:hypothetical protein
MRAQSRSNTALRLNPVEAISVREGSAPTARLAFWAINRDPDILILHHLRRRKIGAKKGLFSE